MLFESQNIRSECWENQTRTSKAKRHGFGNRIEESPVLFLPPKAWSCWVLGGRGTDRGEIHVQKLRRSGARARAPREADGDVGMRMMCEIKLWLSTVIREL